MLTSNVQGPHGQTGKVWKVMAVWAAEVGTSTEAVVCPDCAMREWMHSV